ncbi:hypothetical protein [Streptomyces sp. NPDC054865]
MQSYTTGQAPEQPGVNVGTRAGPRRVLPLAPREAVEEAGTASGARGTARVKSTGAHIEGG